MRWLLTCASALRRAASCESPSIRSPTEYERTTWAPVMASETCDIISPFKAAVGATYKTVENRILAAIHLRFSLPVETPRASG